jgi:ribose-phosphate pyrophosphokinase
MNPSVPPLVFVLQSNGTFGERVCALLKLSPAPHEEREFEDGEHKCRPLINVRGQDVFVIHSLYGEPTRSVNDKLCRLLFFIGALRDASAERITAITPYLCYARKDRKSKARDPVTTRYIAELFEAVGADRVVTLDVHNLAAFQNAFRIRTDHLEATQLLVRHFAPLIQGNDVVVVSPDAGGVKRADEFRRALDRATGQKAGSAFMEKHRSEGVVSGEVLVGDVAGRTAIVIDDLISSGTTLIRAAQTCQAHGAVHIHAAASHGVFSAKAGEILSLPAIEKIVVTDTIPPFRLSAEFIRDKLVVLDATPLFAEAIRRLHANDSIVDLLRHQDE